MAPHQQHTTGADAALILDTANEAFIAMEIDGSVREWNRAAETTFGWSRDEAIGRELASLIIPEELRDAHRKGMARFLETGEGPVLNNRIELPALHRDGRRLDVEITIAAPTFSQGTFFHAFLHDVTARRRAVRSLQAQLEVNEALATASSDDVPRLVLESLGLAGGWSYAGWWLADAHRERLFGYRTWSAPSLDATEFERVTRSLEFRRGDGLPGAAWAEGAPICERDLQTRLLSRRAEVAARIGLHGAVAVPLRAGGVVVGVLEFFADEPRDLPADVDELLRTITPQVGEYVARTRAERRASELKDAFVATVSHELRTPLTSIMGFAQTALDLPDMDAERQREFMTIIFQQSQRLSRLVEDLLDMARIQSGEVHLDLAPLDVEELVRQALAELGRPDLPVRVNGESAIAIADPDACKQLVTNLVDNAGRYAGGATAIEISVGDAALLLAVRDEGPGVPEGFRSRLFERFSRASTAPDVPGTGLGLSIVLALAELQGGTAWYEPNEPCGSCFMISMRRPSRRDPARTEAPEPHGTSPGDDPGG